LTILHFLRALEMQPISKIEDIKVSYSSRLAGMLVRGQLGITEETKPSTTEGENSGWKKSSGLIIHNITAGRKPLENPQKKSGERRQKTF